MTSEYGSSKESSSGSSYLSSSSCSCEFLVEVTLNSAASAIIKVTNLSDCTQDIISFVYAGLGDPLSITAASPTRPTTLASNEFAEYAVEEDFDIRGLAVDMQTSCKLVTFQIPFS